VRVRHEWQAIGRWGNGTNGAFRGGCAGNIVRAMKKRALAALLWFYTGWYGGALLAQVLGITELVGPVVGTAAAALFAGDPRGVIWKTAATASATMPSERQPA